MPVVLPERDPCQYCENFAGRYAWYTSPAVVAEDDTLSIFLAPAPLGGNDVAYPSGEAQAHRDDLRLDAG